MTPFFNALKTRNPVTYEVSPPKGCSTENICRLEEIAPILAGVTVTDNPMATLRASSIAYGDQVRSRLGLPVAPNLSCRDRNLLALQSEALGAHMLGFRDMFIVSGDAPLKPQGFRGVWEVDSIDLCRVIKGLNNGVVKEKGRRKAMPDSTEFSVGGAVVTTRPNEQQRVRRKQESGFDYYITQITYDSRNVVDFLADAELGLGETPIQVGVASTGSPRALRRVLRMNGVTAPDNLYEKLSGSPDFGEELQSYLLEFIDEVKSGLTGLNVGFHVMPIGGDEAALRLVKELKN